MPAYNGFNRINLSVMRQIVFQAMSLATRCGQHLSLYQVRSGSYPPRVEELLQMCFNTRLPNHEMEVAEIQSNFASFEVALRPPTFRIEFTNSRPANTNVMPFGAFVERGTPATIFIREEFFHSQAFRRPAALIHEHIHLIYPHNVADGGHPGGQVIGFFQGQPPGMMGIPLQDAILNPYCYQQFAESIDNLKPVI